MSNFYRCWNQSFQRMKSPEAFWLFHALKKTKLMNAILSYIYFNMVKIQINENPLTKFGRKKIIMVCSITMLIIICLLTGSIITHCAETGSNIT